MPVSSVNAATSATTLASARASRKMVGVYYDDAAILYLLADAGTPSATNYTVKLGAGYFTYWESPPGYSGDVKGLWSSATGAALVTDTL